MAASGRPGVAADSDDAPPRFNPRVNLFSRPADVLLAMLEALSSALVSADARGVFAGADAHDALKTVQAIQQRALGAGIVVNPDNSAHLKLLEDRVAARLALVQRRSQTYRASCQL